MFYISKKRQLDCYEYSHEGAAGFAAYLRGHISMFNYIKRKFSLDFGGSCISSKLRDSPLWYNMDTNKHTRCISEEKIQTGEIFLKPDAFNLQCSAHLSR